MRNRGTITKAQQDFRDSILKKGKKEKSPISPPKAITRNEYMNNCMFWINEYEAGRTTKERFLKAIGILRDHCNQIIQEKL